jgi:hypothetical protein
VIANKTDDAFDVWYANYWAMGEVFKRQEICKLAFLAGTAHGLDLAKQSIERVKAST